MTIQLSKVMIAAAMVAAGCGSNPKPADEPTSGDADCAAVAAHVTSLMEADHPGDNHPEASGVLSTHCVDDGWTAEARACLLAMTGEPEASRRCITAEQGAKLDEAMEALFGEGEIGDGDGDGEGDDSDGDDGDDGDDGGDGGDGDEY